MKTEWPVRTIDEIKAPTQGAIAMGPFGSNIKAENYQPSGVPVIRGFNLNAERFYDGDFVFLTEEKADELRNSNAFPQDLVFTAQGTIGQVGIVPANSKYNRFVLSQNLMKATCDLTKVEPSFMYYYFRSVEGQNEILSYANPTGVPSISRPLSSLKSFRFPCPPLPEQSAIARILGTLDDKIELNRRMNETLEAMARALFKSWFVDFKPVRAKAEGRQPAGMDAETAALFPDSFEDSPLGEVPKEWRIAKLGDVVGINEQSVAKGYSYTSIEYIDISSVTEGRLEGATTYDILSAPSRAKRLVKHGDTIWSTVRPNRKSYFFIHQPKANLVVSTGFAVLTPHSIPSSFLYAWVTTKDFVDYLVYNADGSAYPAVLPARFADAAMLLPSTEVLEVFERCVGPMRQRIAHNEEESHTLAALRDALLPKLMSGEVRVKVDDTRALP